MCGWEQEGEGAGAATRFQLEAFRDDLTRSCCKEDPCAHHPKVSQHERARGLATQSHKLKEISKRLKHQDVPPLEHWRRRKQDSDSNLAQLSHEQHQTPPVQLPPERTDRTCDESKLSKAKANKRASIVRLLFYEDYVTLLRVFRSELGESKAKQNRGPHIVLNDSSYKNRRTDEQLCASLFVCTGSS